MVSNHTIVRVKTCRSYSCDTVERNVFGFQTVFLQGDQRLRLSDVVCVCHNLQVVLSGVLVQHQFLGRAQRLGVVCVFCTLLVVFSGVLI